VKMLGIIVKTFLSFFLIITLMFLAFYILRKFHLPVSNFYSSEVGMRIYGRLQIQPRKSVYIVRVLNRILIIGVSENSINLLSEINDPEFIRALDELYSPVERKDGKFFILK